MSTDELIAGLPGEDIVRQGLADLHAGRCTVPACLVSMASPRLRQAGLMRGEPPPWQSDAELCLYELLRREEGDAYSRYNALQRELVSFEQCLDHRLRRALTASGES